MALKLKSPLGPPRIPKWRGVHIYVNGQEFCDVKDVSYTDNNEWNRRYIIRILQMADFFRSHKQPGVDHTIAQAVHNSLGGSAYVYIMPPLVQIVVDKITYEFNIDENLSSDMLDVEHVMEQ